MERSEKRLLILLSALLVLLLLVTAVFVLHRRADASSVGFELPAFDASAVPGVPAVTDERAHYGELELPITKGRCVVAADATPALEDGALNVFLTSYADNTVYIRLIIYSDSGEIIGESGLLRPGEYLRSVSLALEPSSGATLRAKLLTYAPDTYYSMGSAGVSFCVA